MCRCGLIRRGLNAIHLKAEVFHLDIILDAVFRAFTALAGLFDTAEWCDFGGDQASIDTDHAIFQRLGNPEDPLEIGVEEIGSQTLNRVIRFTDNLLRIFETDDRR